MKYRRVLTIAGSDSGGGAGIQADIKSISACGCFATSAITAITAQNTLGVRDIHPIPAKILSSQISAVLEDIGTDAVKIGMLHSSEVIKVVAEMLSKFAVKNVVLDPVMVATSGDKLLQDEAICSLQQDLIPLARIITPNIPEAEILLDKKITNQEQLPEFALELAERYKVSVLLKAGHLQDDELVDVFYDFEEKKANLLQSKRLSTKNTHGTGCTLSSALAAFLAQGHSLKESVCLAREYLSEAIKVGADYTLGEGHGPVHHFHKFWE